MSARTPVPPVALALALASSLWACRPVAPEADGTPPQTHDGVTAAAAANEQPQTARARTLQTRVLGRTVGTMAVERTPLPDGGERWDTRTELLLALDDAGDDPKRIESRESVEYGPGFAFRRSEEISVEAGVEERSETTLAGEQLTVRVRGPAHDRTHHFTTPADFRSELSVFDELVREAEGGAKPPLTRSYSSFDDDNLRFERDTLTLLGATTIADGEQQIAGWRIEARDGDGDRVLAVLDRQGMPLSLEVGVFTASLPGNAKDEPQGRLSSYLTIDGNVPRRAESFAIELRVEGDDDTAPLVESGPYQDVTRIDGGWALTLHARNGAGLRARALPLRDVPADVRRFLEPTTTSQSDDPAIVEQARALVDGQTDARTAAVAIVQWVHETLGKRDGTRGAATAAEVLSAGYGDCTEHAALAVALLRAAGLPARNASGMVLIPGFFSADAGYHAWVEVWLGDWVVLDPALGVTDVAAHYVLLGYDEPGLDGGGGRLARMLGRTTVHVPPAR
ncbi:MAG: transglutaminase-like domain-containing protein [Nannocystaceae bacterium]|nr:transglutaminase-like domain-containing protein [Nannocystaceae bacterium]